MSQSGAGAGLGAPGALEEYTPAPLGPDLGQLDLLSGGERDAIGIVAKAFTGTLLGLSSANQRGLSYPSAGSLCASAFSMHEA